MDSGMLVGILTTLAARSPMFIAWLVAVAIAIVRWKRHPKVSLLVLIAVTILSLEMIIGTSVSMYMPLYMRESHRSMTDVGVFFAIYGIATSVVSAGCWGLLIAAIFGWRGETSSDATRQV